MRPWFKVSSRNEKPVRHELYLQCLLSCLVERITVFMTSLVFCSHVSCVTGCLHSTVVYCTQHEIITHGLYSCSEINLMTSDVIWQNQKKMCDPFSSTATTDYTQWSSDLLTSDLLTWNVPPCIKRMVLDQELISCTYVHLSLLRTCCPWSFLVLITLQISILLSYNFKPAIIVFYAL